MGFVVQTGAEALSEVLFLLEIRALRDTRLFGPWNSEMFHGWNASRLRQGGWSVSPSSSFSKWCNIYFSINIQTMLLHIKLTSPSHFCIVSGSWACGVILFTLLAGSPPFWHRKQMLMLRMIMEGRYQFSSPEWDDRSDTVKDLVRWCSVRLLSLISNPKMLLCSVLFL